MVQLVVHKDYQTLSRQAAKLVANKIRKKANLVLGLATGSTPLGMYKELVHMYQENVVNFADVITFNLDEYVGLSKNHPQSYYHFMSKHLFSKVNISPDHIHFPNGIFSDPYQACIEYEQSLESFGNIDLQILGIGTNGHIGFNEPDATLTLTTHITDLSHQTMEDNARFFEDLSEVPRKAITMGIGSIMKAKTILLLANDEIKADALHTLFSGTVDPKVPASILQLHPNVLVFISKSIEKHLKEDLLQNQKMEVYS